MMLKDYLTDRDGYSRGGRVLKDGATLAELAKGAGVSTRHLYQVAMGVRRPSWLLASKIETLTGGKVQQKDLLGGGEIRPARPARRKGIVATRR